MPKFECRCSFVFNLSKSPSQGEHLLIPDVIVADLLDADGLSSEEISAALDPVARQVLLCPQCGRLWLQREPEVNEFVEYVAVSGTG